MRIQVSLPAKLLILLFLYILILKLITNAVTTVQEKAIYYSRTIIFSLISTCFIINNNLYINFLNSGLILYNGLFNITTFTQSFSLFILFLAILIAALTAIYPNKIVHVNNNVSALMNESNIIDDKYKIPSENARDLIKTSLTDHSFALALKQRNFFRIGKHLEQFTIIEYALITLFILSGAMFLMSTNDLISLFLSIELQSYGLYILATLYRNSESATSSGLTYFLLGGLSSCFILLGSAILYVNSGTTSIDNIYIINSIGGLNVNNTNDITSWIPYTTYDIHQTNYINLSFTILIVGFLFKISAAPFHFWSPDVYDGIPTVVTTFVAVIAKVSLFTILLELLSNFVSNPNSDVIELSNQAVTYLNGEWKNTIILSSLISLIIGSLLGLTQYRIKRLFAYSTISHVGFILLALSINKMESIQGYIFYILQYSLSNVNAFLLIITIGYTLSGLLISNKSFLQAPKTSAKGIKKEQVNVEVSKENLSQFIDKENSPIQLLNQLKGYFYLNQFLALSLAITLFSFIGIPPLIGFFAKQMVLSAALDEGYVFMTLVGIITSVIGAAYYLNVIKLMFFSRNESLSYELSSNGGHTLPASASNSKFPQTSSLRLNDYLSIIISLLTMIITLFIFVPGEWFRITSILSLSISKI